MEIQELLSIVKSLPAPKAGDVGRLLFAQGVLMQAVGMEMLKASEGSTRKAGAACSILSGAEKALSKSVEYLQEQSKLEERRKLLEIAFDHGYEVAFEADGRLTLECDGRSGRLPVTSV